MCVRFFFQKCRDHYILVYSYNLIAHTIKQNGNLFNQKKKWAKLNFMTAECKNIDLRVEIMNKICGFQLYEIGTHHSQI